MEEIEKQKQPTTKDFTLEELMEIKKRFEETYPNIDFILGILPLEFTEMKHYITIALSSMTDLKSGIQNNAFMMKYHMIKPNEHLEIRVFLSGDFLQNQRMLSSGKPFLKYLKLINIDFSI